MRFYVLDARNQLLVEIMICVTNNVMKFLHLLCALSVFFVQINVCFFRWGKQRVQEVIEHLEIPFVVSLVVFQVIQVRFVSNETSEGERFIFEEETNNIQVKLLFSGRDFVPFYFKFLWDVMFFF